MIRTGEQLEQALADDLIWRKKELSELRFLVNASKPFPERHRAIMRGTVALLYAHWEGYVRSGGRAYLEYVAFQRLTYQDLASSFVALSARKMFHDAGAKRISAHIQLIDFFRLGQAARSNVPYKDGINTESNLSSVVAEEIVRTLGLDFSFYETKRKLIDGLVAKRNSIAHGEDVSIDVASFEGLQMDVLNMIEVFRNLVSNAAATAAFKTMRAAV